MKKFISIFLIPFLFEYNLFAESKFIDETTLEVTTSAKRKPSSSKATDQASCYDAASTMAKFEAVEALVDKNWPNVTGKITKEEFKKTITTNVSGRIKGGKFTSVSFDDSTNPYTCKIVFLITKLNMDSIVISNEIKPAEVKPVENKTTENKAEVNSTLPIKDGKVILNNASYPVLKNVDEVLVSSVDGIKHGYQEESLPKGFATAKSLTQLYQNKKIDNISISKFTNQLKSELKHVWMAEAKKGKKNYCVIVVSYDDGSMNIDIAPNCTKEISNSIINDQ